MTRPSLLGPLFALVLALLVLVSGTVAGCGGGSGGSTGTTGTTGGTRLTGRVLSIVTGGPLLPAPGVQSGGNRVSAGPDGAFLLASNAGAVDLLVDTAAFGVLTFPANAASGATTDVGDLFVGPERITVSGTVRDATSGAGLAGTAVNFGGRRAVTGADGAFSLAGVAYSSASTAGFFGLVGNARKDGYVAVQFTAGNNLPSGGAVNLGDVLLSPNSDPNPPGLPFTIFGSVTPAALASGAIVHLRDASGAEVRRYTVGADGQYRFFVAPGAYAVSAESGARAAGPFSVTLATTTDVVRRDVAFP